MDSKRTLLLFFKFLAPLIIKDNFSPFSNNIENHERLTFRTGNVSTGLKFDNILYLKDKTLSRNGFIEYIYDLTPDIDHYVRSHIDNVSVKKTIHGLRHWRSPPGLLKSLDELRRSTLDKHRASRTAGLTRHAAPLGGAAAD